MDGHVDEERFVTLTAAATIMHTTPAAVLALMQCGMLTDTATAAQPGPHFERDELEALQAELGRAGRLLPRPESPACPSCGIVAEQLAVATPTESTYRCNAPICPASHFTIRWRSVAETRADTLLQSWREATGQPLGRRASRVTR